MLRIFRGKRHVEDAAQPEQREQGGVAQAEQGRTTESAMPVTAGTAPTEASRVDPPTTEAASQEATGGYPPTAEAAPAEATPVDPPTSDPGFLERGRMRRRARFLRAARELAYRDLGGLVFDLHRFGQRNDEIVSAKLDTLDRIDAELRVLEAALRERRPVTVLREAGVAACPRCAAIHGSGDRFCPTCGLSVDQAERPIASPNVVPPVATPAALSRSPAPVAPSDHAAPEAALPPDAPPRLAASPPIPQPNLPASALPAPPVPAASPPAAPTESPAAPPAPATPAAPMPPGLPSPGETPEPEQATQVISPARDGRTSQPTVAFDPLSSPDGMPSVHDDPQGPEGPQEQETKRS